MTEETPGHIVKQSHLLAQLLWYPCQPFCFNFFFFFPSLTAVPSENQCMSSGAYEWTVLVSLKHAVGLSQHWFSKFLLQECFWESHSKLMACSPTCELHSPHLRCGLELILAVYREVHAHMHAALFWSTSSNGMYMYSIISTLAGLDAWHWVGVYVSTADTSLFFLLGIVITFPR